MQTFTPSLPARTHIKAEEQFLIPQVEPAIGHDGMHPDFAFRTPLAALRAKGEAAVLLPTLGRGINQGGSAGVLIDQIELSIGRKTPLPMILKANILRSK